MTPTEFTRLRRLLIGEIGERRAGLILDAAGIRSTRRVDAAQAALTLLNSGRTRAETREALMRRFGFSRASAYRAIGMALNHRRTVSLP